MFDLSTFAVRVRSARQSLKLSQVALSYQTGVHVSDISRFENARLIPTRNQAKRLAEALGIPRDELLQDDEELVTR